MLAVFAGLAIVHAAWAQPLTTAFTYQGELSNASAPADGAYDLRFSLFDAASGGAQVGTTLCVDNVQVVSGRFIVQLDFGSQYAGQQRFLEVRVRADSGQACANTTGYTTLTPRQPLTAAPYANYATGAGTAAIATTAANASQLNGQAASFYTNAANLTTGTIPDARLSTTVVRTNTNNNFGGSNSFAGTSSFTGLTQLTNTSNVYFGDGAGLAGLWRLGGNAGTSQAADFIGTTDTVPVNIRANNRRASTITFTQDVFGTPGVDDYRTANINNGCEINFVGAGVSGATIAGGGADLFNNGSIARWTNRVTADFGTIGGGAGNHVNSASGFIGGGNWNTISTNSVMGVIVGGNENLIAPNVTYGTILGGFANASRGGFATIAGGSSNTAYAGFMGAPSSSTVGNAVTSTTGGAVVAGHLNIASDDYCFIGTGLQNSASADFASILGGQGNVGSGLWSTVGGGLRNQATQSVSVVAGGQDNAASGIGASVLGGAYNVAAGLTSTVNGGISNTALGEDSVVAGGFGNTADGFRGTVGGGVGNVASGDHATIAGGYFNAASGGSAFIPGGANNTAAGALSAAMGNRAAAQHDGTFVWADSTDAPFQSTATQQFLIRATNGVGINTTAPNARLNVFGPPTGVNIFTGDLAPFGIAGIETNFSSGALGASSHIYCAVDGAPSFSVNAAGQGFFAESVSASSSAILDRAGANTLRPELRLDPAFEVAGISTEVAGGGSYTLVNFENNFRTEGADPGFAQGGMLRIDARPFGEPLFQFWHRAASTGTETLAGSLTNTGNFVAAGTITGTAKFFEIDHPSDPANKTLKHACMESDEYKNFYDGVAVTDDSGYATIQLPPWMTDLNENFRYQLTVIDEGDSGDPLMWARIARKVDSSNSFVIRTSGPGIEVSWMVTGVRKDAWAKANPFVAENTKADLDKGRYLTPEAHAKPPTAGINTTSAFEARSAAHVGPSRPVANPQ